MKKIMFTTIAFTAVFLAGCDDKFQLSQLAPPSDPPSISEMIASGKEELSYECKKGNVTFDCEFLTGDLLGSGKWHHTKIFLHSGNTVTMNIDGVSYFQKNLEKSVFEGENTTSIELAEAKGGKANVRIVYSNDGTSINFDAYDDNDKRFVMGGGKIN